MPSRPWRTALVAALVCFPGSAQAATLSVDLSERETPRLRLGFLHGMTSGAPDDELIRPLRPRAWRSNDTAWGAPYVRARAFGSRYSLVLSDRWAYPMHGWGGRGRPWEQLDRFDRFVRELARGYRGRGLIYWDIWNEPDLYPFWDGSPDQFFRTFAVAARALKAELGDAARIVAPSTSRFRLDWIKGLADHCVHHGCEINAVSWHDLRESTAGLEQLSEQVLVTRSLLSGPRYRELAFSEIHLNEIVGPWVQFEPAAQVRYFAELEHAGVDVAIKACWLDSVGRSTCEGTGLAGLIDPASGRPRSVWHTWRAYADGSGSRVRAHSTDPLRPLLASRRSRIAGAAQLLVAETGPVRGQRVGTCLRARSPHAAARQRQP